MGLSHGTAGIAFCLLKLHEATGVAAYRETAESALRYEAMHFDPNENTWPNFDLQEGARSSAVGWCHGAPGIGVSRVLAYRILRDRRLLEEARTALDSTGAALQDGLDNPGRDFQLCHGVAGLAECVWLMEEELGNEDALAHAYAVGLYGVERFGIQANMDGGGDMEWPTGAATGIYPPLFLGAAGIAHFLLRLHAPKRVPTFLVPGIPMMT